MFVLLHQLHIFSEGKLLPDQPPIHPTVDVMETSRAKRAGIDSLGPKQSAELSLGQFLFFVYPVFFLTAFLNLKTEEKNS